MLRLLADLQFAGAPDDALQRQPAGYDLTLQAISRFSGTGAVDLTNERRVLPDATPVPWPTDGSLARLSPGGYLVTYNEVISVPADAAGIVLPRSSLMRCGATLHSALWDPGYTGRGQGLLTVFNDLELYPDARIGQFILLKMEQQADSLYSGRYQGENL